MLGLATRTNVLPRDVVKSSASCPGSSDKAAELQYGLVEHSSQRQASEILKLGKKD